MCSLLNTFIRTNNFFVSHIYLKQIKKKRKQDLG